MNETKYCVTNDAEHAQLLVRVDALMRKGEDNVTSEESQQILKMAIALQAYESTIYEIKPPVTAEGIAELREYERRLARMTSL